MRKRNRSIKKPSRRPSLLALLKRLEPLAEEFPRIDDLPPDKLDGFGPAEPYPLQLTNFKLGDSMSQNHYSTKTKRRVKNKKRKDPSAATMAKIRKLEAASKAK